MTKNHTQHKIPTCISARAPSSANPKYKICKYQHNILGIY